MSEQEREGAGIVKSVIFDPEQLGSLKEIQRLRSTPYASASFTSVVREIVDLGLREFHRADDMISETSLDQEAVAV